MRLVSEPKVYLVTRPSVDWEQVAAFLEDEGVPPIPESIRAGQDESSAVVEISARLCYMSFGRGRRDIADFINNLLSSKDGSVFEHVNYGFVITGLSRSLTHELVRHRAGFAYSQRSQRYVDESGSPFVIPPALAQEIGDNEEAYKVFENAMDAASSSYDELLSALEENDNEGDVLQLERPKEGLTAGGEGRSPKRHRDQDIRHGERQGVEALYRDARGLICGLGDTPPGDNGPGDTAGGGPAALRRLRGGGPARWHSGGHARLLQGLDWCAKPPWPGRTC